MYSGLHNALPGVVDSADPGAVYDGQPGGMYSGLHNGLPGVVDSAEPGAVNGSRYPTLNLV